MHQHRLSRSGALTLATLLAIAVGQSATAQKIPDARSERGAAEYKKYCAACHGVSADGRGLVAPALKVAPPDLTRLTERYGDPFPRQKLMEFIDGRRPLVSHGSREMPVWGDQLWKDLPGRTPEMRKRGTILVLVDYLQSIQVPAD